MNRLTALKAGRELLAQPGIWTKSAGARAKDGTSVSVIERSAVRFCAAGVLGHLTQKRSGAPGFKELDDACQTIFGKTIGVKNDHPETTLADILRIYDYAIGRLEGTA